MQYHLDLQTEIVEGTVQALRENTYVDYIMQVGCDVAELEKFKLKATEILESAQLPVHKWESNVETLQSEDMPNHQRFLVLLGTKQKTKFIFRHLNIQKELKLRKSRLLVTSKKFITRWT